MSFTQQAFTISADKILIDNKEDRFSNHCELATPGNVSENDLHIKDCHLKLVDGALQTDQIQSRGGTTMIDFDGGNSSIDFNNMTVNNLNLGTITLADKSVATSAIASSNYSGQDLEYELDQLQSNINAKVSTAGNVGSKYLTTTAAGTIQFSKSISDVVDLTTAQELENKTLIAPTIKVNSGNDTLVLPSSAGTLAKTTDIDAIVTGNNNFTGNNTFTNADLTSGSEIKAQGDLIIDTTEDGRLRYERSQPFPQTGTVKTFLDITDHQNTGVGPFSLILPSIRSGATQDVLVGRETTDTLLNKTMDYNSNTFQNFPTAEVSLSGSETLTNKTMDYNSNTFQNFPTGDVTLNGSETLTNKTMDYNSNTFQNFPTGLQASDNINFSGNCTFSNPTHFGTTSSDGTVSVLYSNSANYALNVMNSHSTLPQARFYNGTNGIDIHTGNTNFDDFALSARGYNGIGFNVMNDGKVGIDTTSPYCSLQIGALGAGHASTGGGYNSTQFARLAFPSHHHDNNRFVFSNRDPSSSKANLDLTWIHSNSAINKDLMTFDGVEGNCGIGTTTPRDDSRLHMKDTITVFTMETTTGNVNGSYVYVSFRDTTGEKGFVGYGSGNNKDLYVHNNQGGLRFNSTPIVSSDDRVKHNETEVQDALKAINKIQVRSYIRSHKLYDVNHNYELDEEGNPITEDDYTREVGVIAQQLQSIEAFKHSVTQEVEVSRPTDPKKYITPVEGEEEEETKEETNEVDTHPILSVKYNDIFMYNVQATQELSRQLDAAKQEIAALKQQVQTLFSLYQAS